MVWKWKHSETFGQHNKCQISHEVEFYYYRSFFLLQNVKFGKILCFCVFVQVFSSVMPTYNSDVCVPVWTLVVYLVWSASPTSPGSEAQSCCLCVWTCQSTLALHSVLCLCICVCLEVSDPVSGLSSSLLHTEQTVSGRQSSSCIFAAKGNIPSWRELWIMKRGCCLFRQHKPDLLGEITCFTSLKHLSPSEGWRSSSANVRRISAGRLF